MCEPDLSSQQQPSRRVIGIELAVVFLLAVFPLIYGALLSGEGTESFRLDMAGLSVYSIQVGAPVLFIMWRSGVPWSEYGFGKPRPVADGAKGLGVLFVTVVIVFVVGYVYATFFEPVENEETQYTFSMPSGRVDVILLVTAMVLNAFFEETVMRAYFITRLKHVGLSTLMAVIFSTAVFASYHLYQGGWAVVVIFVIGLVYALAFVAIRRIWPLVLAHWLYDLLVYATA